MWFLCAGAPPQEDQPDDMDCVQQRIDKPAGTVVLHSAHMACQPATSRDLPSDSINIQQLLAEVIGPPCHNVKTLATVHHSAGSLVAEQSAGVVYDEQPANRPISDLQLVNVN